VQRRRRWFKGFSNDCEHTGPEMSGNVDAKRLTQKVNDPTSPLAIPAIIRNGNFAFHLVHGECCGRARLSFSLTGRFAVCTRPGPHRRCGTSGPDVGERWSSRLVATSLALVVRDVSWSATRQTQSTNDFDHKYDQSSLGAIYAGQVAAVMGASVAAAGHSVRRTKSEKVRSPSCASAASIVIARTPYPKMNPIPSPIARAIVKSGIIYSNARS
jgi:hypothetical protein